MLNIYLESRQQNFLSFTATAVNGDERGMLKRIY